MHPCSKLQVIEGFSLNAPEFLTRELKKGEINYEDEIIMKPLTGQQVDEWAEL